VTNGSIQEITEIIEGAGKFHQLIREMPKRKNEFN
jgi:hypothetical protein